MRTSEQRSRAAIEVDLELARRQMTKADLARGTGIHPSILYRRLNDESPFKLPEVFAICDFFGITKADFFSRIEEAEVA